jgi:ribonuclease-3
MVQALDLADRRAMEPDRGHLLTKSLTLKSVNNPALSDATREFLTRVIGADNVDAPEWIAALTHGSFAAQAAPRGKGIEDYQRLEFLGDRVLGLTIAEWLYQSEGAAEGRLSQRLNVLVSRQMCATVARGIGLGEHMRLGKQARDDGGADSENILGDVMEALIGASFVTRGFEPTRALIRSLWAEAVGGHAGQAKHPKSALQEWAAGNRRKPPNIDWLTVQVPIMPPALPSPWRSRVWARSKPSPTANRRPKPRRPPHF